jgi:hypothetical protein
VGQPERRTRETLRNFYLAVLALVALSAPITGFAGYYAPTGANAPVWTLSGHHTQNVCY